MAPGIGGLEHQPSSQPFLELRLQRIVIGDSLAALHANRSEYVARRVHAVAWVKDGLVFPVGNTSWIGRTRRCARGRNGIAFIDHVQMPALRSHVSDLK